ncbi:MAG: hypothetical protein WC862_04355 [Patescibacteria group bacterium]
MGKRKHNFEMEQVRRKKAKIHRDKKKLKRLQKVAAQQAKSSVDKDVDN